MDNAINALNPGYMKNTTVSSCINYNRLDSVSLDIIDHVMHRYSRVLRECLLLSFAGLGIPIDDVASVFVVISKAFSNCKSIDIVRKLIDHSGSFHPVEIGVLRATICQECGAASNTDEPSDDEDPMLGTSVKSVSRDSVSRTQDVCSQIKQSCDVHLKQLKYLFPDSVSEVLQCRKPRQSMSSSSQSVDVMWSFAFSKFNKMLNDATVVLSNV